MNLEYLTAQMANRAEAIRSLVQGVSDEQARWKPDPETWSLLEVIVHLADEEREDFRARLDCILHHPDEPWPSIDPPGWVTERRYNQRDVQESLDSFLHAREESLAWLRGLSTPNWEPGHAVPDGGITAGDMLASWMVHDLLHMRQLVELHRAYTLRLVYPHSADYAGPW